MARAKPSLSFSVTQARFTKMRWRDRIRKDLKKFGIEERNWYMVAQDRRSWRRRCRLGMEKATKKRVQEDKLRRTWKAAELRGEDSQPGEATALPFQCDTCHHAFRSR